MMSRRTRAATAKSSTMKEISGATKIDVVDLNFASPKRKDCKLDMDLVSSSVQTMVQTNERTEKSTASHTTNKVTNAATTNGKRNHKMVGGGKTKKVPQAITKYFHKNGHNDSNGSLNCSINESETSNESNVNVSETALPNGDVIDVQKNVDAAFVVENGDKTVPIQNGSVLMSPEAKSLSQNGVKQTTPHRIMIRSSPTKKQRLYVKDPVEVFSNLNIRDGGVKTGRKGQQKTRRKLNITEPEQIQNGTSDNVEAAADDVKPVVKEKAKQNKNITKSNGESFPVPTNPAPRRIQSTQLTDFFPIRRSARKTKKVVEEELSRHIEMAIEKQLEDGLIVKMFAEKGRGIVAGRDFQRGEFVVEYIGELIDQTEADCREEIYSQKADFGCYMYYFKHKEQQWCIDATSETGKLGRLVNHSRNGNLMTKIVSYKNKPHLVLLAKDDIKEGEELTYDYGDRRKEALIHHPWLAF
ncbi:N-lysine methyltransferase KMT5A-like [Contarinia nasturtii]|uniref:N-lysine methyltransferase KMT5A-like n=1 Tax=Contarinia nasturtii TaxID=265458 RepID=UPI0012D3A8CF|nr:N-lysine methyltransferase KMT5A-like [Contarinia nasturtii]